MKKNLKISWIVIGIAIFIWMSFLLTNKASALTEPTLNHLALAQNQQPVITYTDKLYLDIDFGVTQDEVEHFYPTITIRNTENPLDSTTIYIEDIWGTPYIPFTTALADQIRPGKYYISDVWLDNDHDYSNYSTNALPLVFDVEFYLIDTTGPILRNLALAQNQQPAITYTDKLYLDIDFGVTQDEVEHFYPTITIRNTENPLDFTTIYIEDIWGTPYIPFTTALADQIRPGKYYISDVWLDNNQDYSNYSTNALPLFLDVEFYLFNTYDVMKEFSIARNSIILSSGTETLTFNTDFKVMPESIAVNIKADIGDIIAYLEKGTGNQYILNTATILSPGAYKITKAILFYGDNTITYGESGGDAGQIAHYDVTYNYPFYITDSYDVMHNFSIVGKNIVFQGEPLTFSTSFTMEPQSIFIRTKGVNGYNVIKLEKEKENQYTAPTGYLEVGTHNIVGISLYYGKSFISYGSIPVEADQVANHYISFNMPLYITTTYDVLKDITLAGITTISSIGAVTLNTDLEVVPSTIAINIIGSDYNGIVNLIKGAGNQYTINLNDIPSGNLELGSYRIKGIYLFYGSSLITYGTAPFGIAHFDTDFNLNFVIAEKSFPDVELGKWFSAGVKYCKDNGLMSGYTSGANAGNFGLNDSITRGQIVTILYRLAGEPDTTALENPFTDVLAGKYYTEPIKWAFSKGITTGKTATTFDPEGYITRQELAVFMTRYASIIENVDVTSTYDISEIADYADISSWAIAPLQYIMEKGVITGDMALGYARILPKSNATRAVAATMLMRFCQNVLNMQ